MANVSPTHKEFWVIQSRHGLLTTRHKQSQNYPMIRKRKPLSNYAYARVLQLRLLTNLAYLEKCCTSGNRNSYPGSTQSICPKRSDLNRPGIVGGSHS